MNRIKYTVLVAMIFGSLATNAQTLFYVDVNATGLNNGTSWANAFVELQTAIDVAEINAPAQLWVKAGTYHPTSGTDRTISFVMKNNVEIYGGFAGTEIQRNQRNWTLNHTILSGDIGTLGTDTDNTHSVISNSYAAASPLTGSSILDGIIVEKGYFVAGILNSGGAGLRNENASPTIRNCTFRNNHSTGGSGGGILNFGESHPIISSSKFYGNFAVWGGAISFRDQSFVPYNVPSTITNCLFYDNSTVSVGSAIYVLKYYVNVINNTITENTTTQHAAGIYFGEAPGISTALYTNNIIWGNTTSGTANIDIQLGLHSVGRPEVTQNIVEGGYVVGNAVGNLNVDPLFFGASSNDFRLDYCGSPAVDAGTSNNLPIFSPTDIDLNPRIFNGTIDMGVYESQIEKPFYAAIETVDVSCFGAADGQVAVNAGGGVGTPSFSIDGVNYTTNTIITGLDIGSYTLSMKDVNNCITTSSIIILQPTELNLSSSNTNMTCNGANDGSITITAVGSSGTYQYQLNSGAFQSSNTFTNLNAGSYTVTVRDQGTPSCNRSTGVISIVEPDELLANITKTDITCNGNDNGSISFTTTGGSGNIEASIDGINYQTVGFTGLSVGNYTVSIKDVNNCTLTESVTIDEPSEMTMTESATTDVECPGLTTGSINTTFTGGVSPLEFSVDGVNFSGNSDFLDLSAGNYDVIARDANGCTFTKSFVITEPTPFVINSAVTNLTCNGANDGTITINASGSTGMFEYQLNSIAFQSSNSFTGLGAGEYTVTIKDQGAQGCSTTTSLITISEPDELVATLTKMDITCHGNDDGVIAFATTGGTGMVEASIDGTNFQTNDFTGLPADNYDVVIKDANGCSLTISETINEPDKLAMTASTVLDIQCFGQSTGSISVVFSGGIAPLEFSIDGTTFSSSSNFANLAAGNYDVVARDVNGCTVSESFIITEPNAFVSNVSAVHNICGGGNDGSISLSPTGGTSPYEFSIDNTTYSSSSSFSNLESGDYTITVLDANSCEYSEQVTITAPDELALSASFDGQVNLTASGGTSPYTYSSDGTTFQNESVFALSNGQYTFTVRDANGCEAMTSESVLVTAVEEELLFDQVNIYPNPVADQIHISGIPSYTVISLIDNTGRIVLTKVSTSPLESISIESLKQGVYMLKLSSEETGQVIRRVVIE